jgi:hypothetical protein
MRITITAITLVATLGLTACQPGGDQTAQASAPPGGRDVQTSGAGTPEAFVRSIYAASPDPMPGGGLWSAGADAQLAETDRLTEEGELGFFEADPICDCQDGTPVLQEVKATSTGPDSADVAVVQGFSDMDATVHRKTYKLVREGGAWRIDDMTYQDIGLGTAVPPFRTQLAEWLADARAQAR